MSVLCPVCKSETNHENADLFSCPDCTHIFQYPPIVKAVYNADYIKERYDKYPTTEIMSYLRVGFLRAFVDKGALLDFGYGGGSFVRAAIKSGYAAFGYDVHGADYGIPTIESLNAAHSWDVCCFFDSMEHVPDLRPIMDLCRRSRKVVVSIPKRPTSFPDNLAWRHYRPFEHLHYFTPKSLSILLDKKIIQVSGIEDTIRGKLPDGSDNIETIVFA